MKTRIIPKSFDALSFAVFLSKFQSEPGRDNGGLGNGGSISTADGNALPQLGTKELDQSHGGGAFVLPKGAVWAGFIKNRPVANSAM